MNDNGLPYSMPRTLLDNRRTRHPQSQDHATAGLFGHSVGALEHHTWMTVVDVGDAGCQLQRGSCCADRGQLSKRVTSESLSNPKRRVTEFFDPPSQGWSPVNLSAPRARTKHLCHMKSSGESTALENDANRIGLSTGNRLTSSGSDPACRDRRPALPGSPLGLGSSSLASRPAQGDGVGPLPHQASWATHAHPTPMVSALACSSNCAST